MTSKFKKLGSAVLLAGVVLAQLSVSATERGFERTDDLAEQSLEGETKVAILIGVDKYDHTSNLNYAEADANALSSFFESQGFIVKPITGFEASRDRIMNRIDGVRHLFENATGKPQGTLVFAFSGHGFNDEEENFLAVADTHPDHLKETAIPLSEVIGRIKSLNARKRVLFIDACRENPEAPTKNISFEQRTFIEQDMDSEGMAIMYSTGQGAMSWEDRKLEKGVFTHFILEGLSGGASNETGIVSFDYLYKYVANRVKKHVYKYFDNEQSPQRSGEWSGDFVLARIKSPVKKPQDTPETVIDNEPDRPIVQEPDPGSAPDFDFLEAAANYKAVRDQWCAEKEDKTTAKDKKKLADKIFEGKYEYAGKKDEQLAWSLYLDSIKHCGNAAIFALSKHVEKKGRCDLAIEYAQWAVDTGFKSARVKLAQLKEGRRCGA